MNEPINNLKKIHTTKLGLERIKRNLNLTIELNSVEDWCREMIRTASFSEKIGKNWYVYSEKVVFTIHSKSYTIITAHKSTDRKRKEVQDV